MHLSLEGVQKGGREVSLGPSSTRELLRRLPALVRIQTGVRLVRALQRDHAETPQESALHSALNRGEAREKVA
jgi:hypothetical protein